MIHTIQGYDNKSTKEGIMACPENTGNGDAFMISSGYDCKRIKLRQNLVRNNREKETF